MNGQDTKLTSKDSEHIVEQVQRRYGKIATGETSGCCSSTCCGATGEEDAALAIGYGKGELEAIPEGANLGLGCGAPVPLLRLAPGETVVDLGAGAGVDAFLAARAVGPTGRVIGVDMTPEMIEKARQFAASSGFDNVEFRLGRLEDLPVESGTVDAVTSNCVINLVPDKKAVFGEVARVLKPKGRLVVSDILLDGDLPEAITDDVLAYVGCVAGATRRETYFALLEEAGLGKPTIFRDVDYLETSGYTFSDELKASLEERGVTRESLAGIVRSVTYGAVRD